MSVAKTLPNQLYPEIFKLLSPYAIHTKMYHNIPHFRDMELSEPMLTNADDPGANMYYQAVNSQVNILLYPATILRCW